MRDGIKFGENLLANMRRMRDKLDMLTIVGKWHTDHYRGGKKIAEYDILNDITTAGKNSLLDTMFNSATQVASTSWYAGLINNASFTGYNAADTMASHSGWTEWTSYSQSTRVLWGQGATASATITNASPIVFDINGTGTIRGLFITTVATKSATTGLLWSGASYTSTVDVLPGDEIRSTYSLSC